MTKTVIRLPSLQGPYHSGIVFAVLEGLKSGEILRLVAEDPPTEIIRHLEQSGIPDVNWELTAEAAGGWALEIRKSPNSRPPLAPTLRD